LRYEEISMTLTVHLDALRMEFSMGASVAPVMSVCGFFRPSAIGKRSSQKKICQRVVLGS
jgi:hypothetical protein